MADDVSGVLTRFHRELVLPDLERVGNTKVDELRAMVEERLEIRQEMDALKTRITE